MTFVKGYKPTAEHRHRLSVALLGHKNSEESKVKMSLAKLGTKQSIERRMRQSLRAKERINNLWKGGITKEGIKIRNSIEYRLWREAVFSRDNWTCQDCDSHGVYIHAHHIKPFSTNPELRFAIDNGVTLCRGCHALRHPEVNLFRAKGQA